VSNYSKTNLKQAEDSAAGRDLDIEARFGRKHLDSNVLGVSYFRYGPGFHNPNGHHHKVQEEAYVVVSGSGRIRVDDDIIEIGPWDVVRVAPEAIRGIEGGPEGIEVIAVGSEKPAEGDGVQVKDWWID
jgi:mannose-6-phosphate isomerase-like protein (cupin superfamily)